MTMMIPPVPPIGKCDLKGGKSKHAGASGAEDKSDKTILLHNAAILEAFKTSTGFASFYKAVPLTPS